MTKVPAFFFRTDYLNHKASLKKSHRVGYSVNPWEIASKATLDF